MKKYSLDILQRVNQIRETLQELEPGDSGIGDRENEFVSEALEGAYRRGFYRCRNTIKVQVSELIQELQRLEIALEAPAKYADGLRNSKKVHVRTPVQVEFFQYVKQGELDDCWEWQGKCNPDGYGHYSNPLIGERLTHRISYYLHHGKILNGLDVLHKCDNPPCVNPRHLFLGTQQDNCADMKAKNRHSVPPLGEAHISAKLTEDKVRICRTLFSEGFNNAEIGRLFNVHSATIWALRTGQTWKHVV